MPHDGLDVLFHDLVQVFRRPSAAGFALKVEPGGGLHVAVDQAMPHELHLMLFGEAHRFIHGIEIKTTALRFREMGEHDRNRRIEFPPHHRLIGRIVIPHSSLNRCPHPEPHRFGSMSQSLVLRFGVLFLGRCQGD